MKNIIGVSGKINSGKDTVGEIIQHLNLSQKLKEDSNLTVYEYFSGGLVKSLFNKKYDRKKESDWEIKKMAGKLKDITCLLIGCTREQLEDREFKETPLGEEWQYESHFSNLVTPRSLMQLLGTECGREILHPNIWANAFWVDYKSYHKQKWCPPNNIIGDYMGVCQINDCDKRWYSTNKRNAYCEEHNKAQPDVYPNWIITDVRFPNEAQSVKERDGLMIRVNRFKTLSKKFISEDGLQSAQMIELDYSKEHPSETGLDNYQDFDYVIKNDGTIEDLIEKVKEILIKEKII